MFNYSVVEHRSSGMDAIKLLDEPFEGIIFTYGLIDIEEDEIDHNITIKFDYEILDKGKKDFGNMEPFENYIGELLQHILRAGIEQENNTVH